MVPCPRCGKKNEFQSKSGKCFLEVYDLGNAPNDVMDDVNRHSPCECECGCSYYVDENLRVPVETKCSFVATYKHNRGLPHGCYLFSLRPGIDPGPGMLNKMEVVLSVNFQTAEVSILSTDGEPYINVKYHRETLTGFDPVASAEAAFLALGYTISGLWLLAQNLRVGANDPEEAPAMDIQVGIYEAPRKPPITVEDIAIYPSSVTTTPWVRWSVPNEPYATRTPIETFRKMIESEGYTFTGR
jgi:hypothetical protein